MLGAGNTLAGQQWAPNEARPLEEKCSRQLGADHNYCFIVFASGFPATLEPTWTRAKRGQEEPAGQQVSRPASQPASQPWWQRQGRGTGHRMRPALVWAASLEASGALFWPAETDKRPPASGKWGGRIIRRPMGHVRRAAGRQGNEHRTVSSEQRGGPVQSCEFEWHPIKCEFVFVRASLNQAAGRPVGLLASLLPRSLPGSLAGLVAGWLAG